MKYLVIVEKSDHNYFAYVPDLPGCVTTGNSITEIEQNIQEAINGHLAIMKEFGEVTEEIQFPRISSEQEVTTPVTDATHTVRASQLIRLLRRNIAVLYTPSVPRHGASRETLKGWCLHILTIPQPLPCFHPDTHRNSRVQGFPHGRLNNR